MIQQNPHSETDESIWIDCECLSMNHAIRVWQMKEEDWNEFIIEMHVRQHRPFWKRLLHGIQYIFNIGNHVGSYDSFHLKPADVDKLVSMMLDFKSRREEKEKKWQTPKDKNG